MAPRELSNPANDVRSRKLGRISVFPWKPEKEKFAEARRLKFWGVKTRFYATAEMSDIATYIKDRGFG